MFSSEKLIPKLQSARAVEFRNGQISFTQGFLFHIMRHLSGQEKPPPNTIASIRNLFGQYDPSLALLEIEEMADVMSLLLFSFQSNAHRILLELRKVA